MRRLPRAKQKIQDANADTWEFDTASGVIKRRSDGAKPLVVIVDPTLRKTLPSPVSLLPPRADNIQIKVVTNPAEARTEDRPAVVCLKLPAGKFNRVRVKRQVRTIRAVLKVSTVVLMGDPSVFSRYNDAIMDVVREEELSLFPTINVNTPVELERVVTLHLFHCESLDHIFKDPDAFFAKAAELDLFDASKKARTRLAVPGEVARLPPAPGSKTKNPKLNLGNNKKTMRGSVVAAADREVYNSAAMAITDYSTAGREVSARGLQWPTEKWNASDDKASRKPHAIVAFLQRVWQPFTQSNGLLITRRELAEHDTDAALAVKEYVRANELPDGIGIIRTRDIKTLQAKNPNLSRVSHLRIA